MKTILALTLLLAATAYGQEKPCEQGHQYSPDGCNTCICSSTGLYACTRLLCNPSAPPKLPVKKVSKRSAGCDKGPWHFDGCNTCVCVDGAYFCEENICPPGGVVSYRIRTRVATKKPEKRSVGCDKGESYSDGCNTCVCAGTTYACTARACLPSEPVIEPTHSVQKRSDGCDKGESYNDGCNTCVCSNGAYACTERACVQIPQFPDTVPVTEASKVDPGCDKGQSYKDDCNTCVCKGGHYACTLMACYHGPQFPDTVQLPQPSKATISKRSVGCVKGDSYFDGCNTCVCAGTTYACTARACLPSAPGTEATHSVQKRSNVPLSLAELIEVKHEIRKRSDGCDKGESYNDGCNTCVCSNGAYVCTERACVQIPQFPDTVAATTLHPSCDKGESYFDGCNTCTCTKIGGYACTKKLCVQFPDATRNRRDAEVEVSTGKYDLPKKSPLKFLRFDVGRCEPNATKNQSCNVCKCTKNGKGWLCTQNLCPSSKQN